MDSSTHSLNKLQASKVEQFQSRFTARLCIVSITILQVIIRLVIVFGDSGVSNTVKLTYFVSIPASLVVWIVIGLEYILFKKIGPRMIKYSKSLDLVLLVVFTLDWFAVIYSPIQTYKLGPPPTLAVSTSTTLITFGYRTLLQLFLVQRWQLRAISPVLVTIFITYFNVVYSAGRIPITVFRGAAQALLVVVAFYFEDKVKWKMMLTNMQQEKWMQINDFILNNIPENIMILDIEGQTKFISDYCKSFLAKCHLPLDAKVFFKQIRDLNQQVESTSHHNESNNPLSVRKNQSTTPLIDHHHPVELQNMDVLEDLLTNFKAMIKDKRLQEKQFLIYNGKLKTDDSEQDKSIEIKISFIEQLEKAYIILIIRDTTQRDLLIALEDNNKYKDQLLASVSHELRAPLNGNINLVETAIQSKMIPNDLKENLLIPALRSSKFLLHLINDILDMSQIKAQKLRLVFQSGSIRETLNDTVKLVELQARKKGIELSVQLEPNLPINFNTDHLRLSQIVLNLLNNAIKFTPQGTVKLVAQGMEMLPWVKISVQDSGIGMTQENIAKLFTTFTHIEFKGREGVNPHGVGLGLTIAHNLAGMLGPKGNNKIQVESHPNKGSIFSFLIENKSDNERKKSRNGEDLDVSDHLMYVPDEHVLQPKMVMRLQTGFSTNTMLQSSDKQDSPLISVNQNCRCPDILIVDDNPFNTMAFETILDSLGVKCEVVYDGKTALERIQGRQNNICKCGKQQCKQYKMIFMDQEMPGMTGSETVREIKSLQRQRLVDSMRIIGCTAHGSKEEVDKFLASGIDQCIHKPISAVLVKRLLDECD